MTAAADVERRARPDRRLGQAWTPAQRLKNALLRWLIAGTIAVTDRLPARLLLAGARVAGRAAARLLVPLRRRAERTLRSVLGETGDPARLAADCLAAVGENAGYTLLLRRPGIRARTLVELSPATTELLRGVLAKGRGAVFVSAHLGPFELVAAAVAELGHRPAVVVRESYDPKLNALVDQHRLARGVEVIHRGDPGCPSRIVRALREGRPVGFLPDLPGRVRTHLVTLMGRPSVIAAGPVRIARRAGCPLLVGTLQPLSPPTPAPFRLILGEISHAGADDATVAQRLADVLSAAIRRAPAQWPWMAAKFPSLQNKLTQR
ncbi:MAG TPA: lysophospholipid acyltransferase family protein [Polyangiaceae bacterium]|nr:lysophospholipid acyltransferase family protein [Polyangiaceae bacterium]